MTMSERGRRLKCRLCRRGLLQEYEVYTLSDGGVPVLATVVNGWFYRKGSWHRSEVIEIAGNIGEHTASMIRLMVFDEVCQVGYLVRVENVYYRITGIKSVDGLGNVLDLEVFPYLDSD